MSSKGYENVPDVELGNGAAPSPAPSAASYPELPEDQGQLMANFDLAAASANLDFKMPQADPAELASQGESMIMSMITPTVASLCTLAAGMLLGYEAQYSRLAAVGVLLFPYINAVIQFVVSINPLQNRLMSSAETIFEKKERTQEIVQDGFDNITRKVDKTVDNLQSQVVGVLDPIRPTLDQASAQAEPLKRLDPDLDIPDVSDIDEEFDEAQGKVGARVAEAKEQLTNPDQYTPEPLHSASKFYWKIIFPILLTALFLQLVVAFATTYAAQTKQPPASSSLSSPSTRRTRYLRFLDAGVVDTQDVVAAQATQQTADGVTTAQAEIDSTKEAATDATQLTTTQVSEQLDATKDEAAAQIQQTTDQLTEQADAAKNEASAQIDAAKEQANQEVTKVQNEVDAAKEHATAQAQQTADQVSQQLDAAKDEALAEADAAKAQAVEEAAKLQNQVDAAKAEATAQAQQGADQVSEQVNAAKDEASAQVDAAKAQAGEEAAKVQAEAEAAKDEAMAQAHQAADQISEQHAAAKDEAAVQVDAAKAQAAEEAAKIQAQAEAVKEEATAQAELAAAQAAAQVEAAKAQAAEEAAKIQAQVDAAKQQAVEEAAKIQAQIDTAKQQAEAQMDAAKQEAAKAQAQLNATKAAAEAKVVEVQQQYDAIQEDMNDKLATEVKPIIISVISSYLLTLLQLGIIFLLTSPKVKAWVINKLISAVQDDANRRLRATGVPDKLHEVLVVRLGRIKAKLYKVFSVIGRIQKVLDRLQGFTDIPGVGKAAEKVSGAMNSMKKSAGDAVANKMDKVSGSVDKASGAVSSLVGGLGGGGESSDKNNPLGGLGFGGGDDGNKMKLGGLGRFGRK
ncbi:hypothetical protein ACA910_003152 [Epithemia clementina (nom. ined.)]